MLLGSRGVSRVADHRVERRQLVEQLVGHLETGVGECNARLLPDGVEADPAPDEREQREGDRARGDEASDERERDQSRLARAARISRHACSCAMPRLRSRSGRAA